MKKLTILAFGLLFCLNALAQIPVSPISQKKEASNSQNGPSYKKGNKVSDWYNWWVDYENFNGGFSYTRFFELYPDTFLKSLRYNSDFNIQEEDWVRWCSIGQGFDPVDDAWEDVDLAELGRKSGFYVDSAHVNYGYFRNNPDTSVVDTVLINVYLSQNNQLADGVFSSDQSLFSVPAMNRIKFPGSTVFQKKIPLRLKDSIDIKSDGSFEAKVLSFKLNTGKGIWIDSSEHMHLTATFIPGQKYAFGDTLYFDDDLVKLNKTAPKRKLNRFGLLVAPQTPVMSKLSSYNNSSFVASWNRYQDPFNTAPFLKSRYWPNRFGQGWTNYQYFPHIGFHVNGEIPQSVSADEVDFVDFKLFPNPANNSLVIQFSSTEKLNYVRATVLDLQGREVAALFNGNLDGFEFSKVFDVSNVQSGVYLVNVNVNGNVMTKKLVKQ